MSTGEDDNPEQDLEELLAEMAEADLVRWGAVPKDKPPPKTEAKPEEELPGAPAHRTTEQEETPGLEEFLTKESQELPTDAPPSEMPDWMVDVTDPERGDFEGPAGLSDGPPGVSPPGMSFGEPPPADAKLPTADNELIRRQIGSKPELNLEDPPDTGLHEAIKAQQEEQEQFRETVNEPVAEPMEEQRPAFTGLTDAQALEAASRNTPAGFDRQPVMPQQPAAPPPAAGGQGGQQDNENLAKLLVATEALKEHIEAIREFVESGVTLLEEIKVGLKEGRGFGP